jgi:predicted MFS family arabinose efflux permease
MTTFDPSELGHQDELDHPNELDQTPTADHPGWNGAASETRVGLLSLVTLFVIGTDTFLVAPLLPLLRQQFGVDVARSGWLVSGYALGYVACSLIAGPISDRVDRRVMLLGGMVAFTVSTAALTVVLAVAFPPVPRSASSGTPSSYRFVLTARPLMLCLLAYLIFQTGNFGALSFYGSWLAKSFHLTENGIGVAMMVIGAGNAAGSLFGARLVARLGQRRSLLFGILAMTAGYALTVPIGQLSLAVGLLMLVMAAGGFVFPVCEDSQWYPTLSERSAPSQHCGRREHDARGVGMANEHLEDAGEKRRPYLVFEVFALPKMVSAGRRPVMVVLACQSSWALSRLWDKGEDSAGVPRSM